MLRRDQFSKILDLESAGREHVATTHPDALARRLTLQTTWLVSGNWYSDALEELKELAPDDPWVALNVERERERAERAAERDKIAVGTPIVDFAAVDLDGESTKTQSSSGRHQDCAAGILGILVWSVQAGDSQSQESLRELQRQGL